MYRPPLALLVASLLGACAHDPMGWKHVTTTHFELYSTEGHHAYAPVLEHLELVHTALGQSIYRGTTSPGFEVFLYNPEDAMPILGSYAGEFLPRLGPRGVLVMRDGADGDYVETIAAQNLSFSFTNAAYPGAPEWFLQGLAGYVGSFRIMSGAACFGGRDRLISYESARGQLVPITDLFTESRDVFHNEWERSHYATSWAVVHYIFHGENGALRSRFGEFAAHFTNPRAGKGATLAAWSAVYKEIPVGQLDNRIRDHLNNVFDRPGGKCMAFPFPRPPEPSYAVEPASPQVVSEREQVIRSHPLRLRP